MSEAALFGLCREEGPRVDDLLRQLAGLLRAQDVPVAGFVQERRATTAQGHPRIVLHDLANGTCHDISEMRGPGASGCNLDWDALTERAVDLERRVKDQAPALVIVSRFGKAEAEGRGFCAVIETCLERGIPVLVAYRTAFSAAWESYHGGLARDLHGHEPAAFLNRMGLLGTASDR